MTSRPNARKAVETALTRSPVCGLMGPRQSGKSTLAREIAAASTSHYFDLESPRGPGSVRAPLAPGVEVVGIEAFADPPATMP